MRWLNYHHLLYFWTVARTGSISAASRELYLSQPAISSQIKALEADLGTPLFARAGRGLELTDAGRRAFEYADRIFQLGSELRRTLAPRDSSRIRVGLGQLSPKLVAPKLFGPALASFGPQSLLVEFREAGPDQLFAMLAARELDVVIAEDDRRFAGSDALDSQHLRRVDYALFQPRVADATSEDEISPAIVLMSHGPPVRDRMSEWLRRRNPDARVVAECEDGALMVEVAQRIGACFAAPTDAPEPERHRQVEVLDGVHADLTLHTTRAWRDHPFVIALRGEGAGAPAAHPERSDAKRRGVEGPSPAASGL